MAEHILEDRIGDGDPYNDAKQWRRILQTLKSYGPDGMSSDDSDVEGLDEVFRVNTLYWRRAEATAYMDILDNERKARNQSVYSKSGSKPARRIRSENPKVSDRWAVTGLPIALYNRTWFDGLKTMERRALQVDSTPLKWITLTTAKHTGDGA